MPGRRSRISVAGIPPPSDEVGCKLSHWCQWASRPTWSSVDSSFSVTCTHTAAHCLPRLRRVLCTVVCTTTTTLRTARKVHIKASVIETCCRMEDML
ncbi:hypothetical protein M405DRAFT_178547 [Rhizopogon salebrosus TDB-379]|nr:hypothetical protein M405DRAFT_178547 [Rhizopogon salebrosus TDB-379]